jgi:hypothetical protein
LFIASSSWLSIDRRELSQLLQLTLQPLQGQNSTRFIVMQYCHEIGTN